MVKNTQIYLKRSFKQDFLASIVVFLVAIPLCLGVALAAGAPIYSGLISGIVGGIVVGLLSQSQLSVSGPSAAIVAIIMSAISQLQHYEAVLLAIFIAGLLQILAGYKKCGFFADFLPNNVIQGMLSAIGILLILKQIPLAFTITKNFGELKDVLIDSAEGIGFHPLMNLSFHLNSGGFILSLTSLGIMLLMEKSKKPFLKAIPSAIVVVITGSLLNQWFIHQKSIFSQYFPLMVNIPQYENLTHIGLSLAKPDWSQWLNPQIYFFALLIAAVISLESLMNINATEKMDPRHQAVNKDRELWAQGVGNAIAALVGGIPLSSVIVRTSVNIQSNAKTKISTIFHGFFLLLSFCFIPHVLNQIPLCVLSSILIFTGYKLTKPKIYIHVYQQGMNRFLPFLVTLISIIYFNLLIGIVLGLITHLFFILRSNSQARIDIIQEMYPQGITNRLVLPQQTTFLNKASLIAELKSIPMNSQLIIDARYTEFMDKEIIEYLEEFKEHLAPQKNISLNLMGFKSDYTMHDHIDFINVTTFDAQSILTPSQVLDILKQGNQRFLKNQRIHRSTIMDIQHTAQTQYPIAVVLGCIDSRVPVETIFDMTFGDLFCIRIAGNVVNDDILASIEYACHIIGAKLIVVLGHTRCGAITAACQNIEEGHITQLLNKIKPAIHIHTKNQSSPDIQNITHLNIAHSMLEIKSRSPILADLLNQNKIDVVGAVYDVTTGKVHFSDYQPEIDLFEHHTH